MQIEFLSCAGIKHVTASVYYDNFANAPSDWVFPVVKFLKLYSISP